MLAVPRPLSLFIGYAEIAGGLGLATIMILAILFHLVRGEGSVVGIPVLMAAFALFVAWGRSRGFRSNALRA